MHPIPFDVLTISLDQVRTRRRLAQLLGRAVLGASSRRLLPPGFASLVLMSAGLPGAATTKKRRNKLKFNAFGCVNVGGNCRGRDNVCCSGICQGKRPKKGKPDKSRCVAHDTGGCAPDQDVCGADGPCVTSGGLNGQCYRTTGNAGFCAWSGGCVGCSRDADCLDLEGPGGACVFGFGPDCAVTCCATPFEV